MKSNSPKTVISIFLLLICFANYAQGPPGGGQGGGRGQSQGQGQGGQGGGKPDASEMLSKLDTNNDKFIDKDEASNDERGKIAENFDEIDTSDDELIDLEELEASLNTRKPKKVSAKKILKEVDDNQDDLLNELEVAAKDKQDLMANFDEIDTNQDSQLDLDELKAFYSNIEDGKKKRKERR